MRKVVIVNNKSQRQYVIQESAATTLGELKREMNELGIDYDGMSFFEGHMRADLKDDSAPLPETIMYKGQPVTDLAFMLTQPEKHIKSGAMNRKEAYAAIKAKGLESVCVVKFGKNFTMCKTQDLIDLLESSPKSSSVQAPSGVKAEKAIAKKAEKPVDQAEKAGQPEAVNPSPTIVELLEKRIQVIEGALLSLADSLEAGGYIEDYEVADMRRDFERVNTNQEDEEAPAKDNGAKDNGKLSSAELAELFGGC